MKTPSDIAKLARTVELTRTATGHKLNSRSSRSHCLVHVYVTQHTKGKVAKRQLLFVDLAGSERIEKSGVEGAAKAQATAINSSLTTLGKVIKALGEGASHVPYRDSVLTMLLRDSFGGRACASMVVNVASEDAHSDETLCSLEFGKRMAVVKDTATVVVGVDEGAERSQLEALLACSRSQLRAMEEKGQGGRFGATAMECEKHAYNDNRRRMAAYEVESRELRAEILEITASGEKPPSALVTKAKNADLEASNLRDILVRQNSIKGFWIPPTSGYTARQQAVKQLEARLQILQS